MAVISVSSGCVVHVRRFCNQNPVARLAHHFRRDALHVDRRGRAAGTGRSLEEHLLQRDVLRPVRTVPRRRPRAVQPDTGRAHRGGQVQRARVGADEQPARGGPVRPVRVSDVGGATRAEPAAARATSSAIACSRRTAPHHQRRHLPHLAQVARHGGVTLGGPKFRRPAGAGIDDRKSVFQSEPAESSLRRPRGLLRARAPGTARPATRFPAAGAVPDSGPPRASSSDRRARC